MKISKKQLLKMLKAVSRQLDIDQGVKLPRSGYHRTDKKDKRDREKNTIRNWEDA